MKKLYKKLISLTLFLAIVFSFSSFEVVLAEDSVVLPDGLYFIKNVGLNTDICSGTYSTIRTSFGEIEYCTIESIFPPNCPSSPEATGHLLWYIERNPTTGNYSITSVSLRPSGNERTGAYKLSACGNYAYLCYNTSHPNSFEISATQNNNVYTGKVIEPSENKYFSASSANVYFFSNGGVNDEWEFTYINTERYNFFWGGSYNQGIYNGVAHIKVVLSDAFINSSMLGGTAGVSRANNAVKKWNGISDKVIIYGPNDSVPAGINPFYVTITTSNAMPVNGLQGNAYGVMLANGNIENHTDLLNDNWNSATIVLNDYSTVENNPFLIYNAGSTEQLTLISATITHEMGHVLKLCHPYESVISGNRHVFSGSINDVLDVEDIYSVMNGGIMFDYTVNGTVIEADKCNSDTPQAFDYVNLRSKWEYHNGCVH